MSTGETKIQSAGLLPDAEITRAWTVLAKSGVAQSYLGCSSDGFHEIALCNPGSRLPLVIGRGVSVEQAIFAGIHEIEKQREQP